QLWSRVAQKILQFVGVKGSIPIRVTAGNIRLAETQAFPAHSEWPRGRPGSAIALLQLLNCSADRLRVVEEQEGLVGRLIGRCGGNDGNLRIPERLQLVDRVRLIIVEVQFVEHLRSGLQFIGRKAAVAIEVKQREQIDALRGAQRFDRQQECAPKDTV